MVVIDSMQQPVASPACLTGVERPPPRLRLAPCIDTTERLVTQCTERLRCV
tara:strand:+ start:591 stop:743 length:153 start_codon:yes stop_codon:yes gene_type:complete